VEVFAAGENCITIRIVIDYVKKPIYVMVYCCPRGIAFDDDVSIGADGEDFSPPTYNQGRGFCTGNVKGIRC